MGVKIVTYTHTDYNWVWPLWFGQTEKYLKEFEKIIFVDKQHKDIPNDYQILQYNDSKKYTERVTDCLKKLNPEDIIIFHHEDMFLYDKPDFKLLDEFIDLIEKDEALLIKLLRAGDSLLKSPIHPNLYFNPNGLKFCIQPTICKVSTLLDIYSSTPGDSIWEFEANAGVNPNIIHSYFYYDNEPLRGLAHYDSKLYPYIATAVVKGKWNMEYSNELTKLFNEYKINNI